MSNKASGTSPRSEGTGESYFALNSSENKEGLRVHEKGCEGGKMLWETVRIYDVVG